MYVITEAATCSVWQQMVPQAAVASVITLGAGRDTMDLTVHDCNAISIDHHMPGNRNCVTLRISRGEDGEPLRVSMFGLPADVTAQLVAALGRPRLVSDIPQVSGAA